MEVNKIDAFSDSINLSKEYDINKDGTVDIADYRLAMIQLNDDDPDTTVNFTKEEFDIAFAELIKADDAANPTSNITDDKANEVAQDIIAKTEAALVDPSKAKDLNELQEMGKSLSKFIKECSNVLPVLSSMIDKMKKELDELAEEKEAKEKEYEGVAGQVDQKSTELATKMQDVMNRSTIINENMQANANNIISKCIEDYKNGEYPNENLYDVITRQLGTSAGGDTSAIAALRREIDACGTLGNEIQALCGDIENLVADIRSIEGKYNDKDRAYNACINNRNGVLAASTAANKEYQKGYARRLELRQEIVDKYHVEGRGRDTNNPQLGMIEKFLNDGVLDNLSFADAYAIMKDAFDGCGISFANGNISMPTFMYMKDESEITDSEHAAIKIFNNLAGKINSRYASTKTNGLIQPNNIKAAAEDDENWDFDDDFDDDLDNEDLDEDELDDDLLDFDEETDNTAKNTQAATANADDENTGGYESADDVCSLGSCTGSKCCDPITFQNAGKTFHFIKDRDQDGIFDDESEFLGAKNGWKEMQAYDADGNGKIEGKELEDLKLVSVDDESGQFSFTSAANAGIQSIDLSTYKDLNELEADGDILQGTFDIQMNDGSTIQASQTDDNMNNIKNRYSTMFGAEIKDMDGAYEENPFMEAMTEKVNVNKTIHDVKTNVSASNSAEASVKANMVSVNNQAQNKAQSAETSKQHDDSEKERKKKEEEK